MAIGETIISIPAPASSCNGVAWDGQNLWANDTTTNRLYEVDPTNGTVINDWSLPSDTFSQISRGMDADGSTLWYSDDGNDKIRNIETDGTEIVSFASPAVSTTGVALNSGYLWATSINTDTLYKIDLSTNSVVDSFDLSAISATPVEPFGVAFVGNIAWISDGDRLHELSEDKSRIARSVNLSFSGALGISYDAVNERFWVATENTIYAVEAPPPPPTILQQWQISYADAAGREPLATALQQRTPAQNLADYLVSIYAGTNPRIVTKPVQIEIDELDKTSPAPAPGDLSRQIWIEDGRDPNFKGGRWATILGRSGGADPGTVELTLFIADNPESFVRPT